MIHPSRIPTVAILIFVIMYYPHPCLLAKSSIAKQNVSHCVNAVCNGSPSRIRSVRRISFGITTRPRSSIRRTMPVAFISKSPLSVKYYKAIVCRRREIMQKIVQETGACGGCEKRAKNAKTGAVSTDWRLLYNLQQTAAGAAQRIMIRRRSAFRCGDAAPPRLRQSARCRLPSGCQTPPDIEKFRAAPQQPAPALP